MPAALSGERGQRLLEVTIEVVPALSGGLCAVLGCADVGDRQ